MEQRITQHINSLINEGEEVKAGDWQGTKDYEDQIMLVLFNANIELECPDSIATMRLKTKADYKWADEHFEERVGGDPSNPGESYKRWPYNAKGFDGTPFMDNKLFTHTYQERFWPRMANAEEIPNTPAGISMKNDLGIEGDHLPNMGIRYEYGDLDDVIKQLNDNPLTRQAYLPIFFPEDTGAVHKGRVPCTLGYQFFIHKGSLHMNYYIRSCDALRHFRNDIYLAMRLMYHMGSKVPHIKRLGMLNMYITNLHVFKNDLYALKKKESK